MRRLRITPRFVILLACAAVLPLIGYGIASIYSLRQGTEQSIIEGNLRVARRAAEQLNLYVATNRRILRAVAADLRGTNLKPWQQDRILKDYALEFPELRELTLFDQSGSVLASSRLDTPRVRPPEGLITDPEGVVMSPITVDDDLLPTTVFTIQIAQVGMPVAWLVAELNLEEMWRMVDQIRIADHGFALLVGSDGRLLAHGDPDQKAKVAQGENFQDYPLVLAMQQAGASQPAWAEFNQPGSTTQVLAVGSTTAAPLDWKVIVEQPTSEAFAVSIQLQRQLIVAIGLALLITVIFGFVWGRSFITPIYALMRATRAVADGHLEERVRIEGRDEFHELGESFNSMADRLVELQEEIRKKERHAVFGRIASGLVHDLAHPIMNIGNSCRLILRLFDDEEYRATFRRTIDREFETIKRMMDDLRNLGRPVPAARFPVDVHRTLGEILESLKATAEEAQVTLDNRFAPDVLFIEGDSYALGRVARNLIVNGIQATPPGGRVGVDTALVDGRVKITVQDTGCGIPAERLAVIFEDFVTTKRQGLGLGLAICQKIIEQLGGHINVTSEVGVGTSFVVDFEALSADRIREGALDGQVVQA